MTRKFLTKPKVTDGERRDRFVAMTQQIGALDDVKNFEKAFQKTFKSAFENVSISDQSFAAPRLVATGQQLKWEQANPPRDPALIYGLGAMSHPN